MNGLDLVQEVLEIMPRAPKIFLLTGIFKDRKFIQDALEKTRAEAFFTKPIDLQEVVAKVREAMTTYAPDATWRRAKNSPEQSATAKPASAKTATASGKAATSSASK